MTTFRKRILESINNENLQTALDNNTERRLKGRAATFESIPDWRERRLRANKIRADVIDNLDAYLEKFIAKNEENGVIVHRLIYLPSNNGNKLFQLLDTNLNRKPRTRQNTQLCHGS